MTPTQQIRAKLTECGDCVNCKLIVWNTQTDRKKLRMNEHIEGQDYDTYHFRVQCNWLKGAVPSPLTVLKCEGKRSHSE